MVQVVDASNIAQFIETGKVDDFKPPEKVADKPKDEPAVASKEAPADEDGLTEDEKAAKAVMGSKKWDQVIGRRHRAQKEAEEARREADSFAENQYRERIAAEKRAAELEAQLNELKSKAQPVKEPQKAPDPKDFKEPSEYWDAKIKWEVSQGVEADRQLRATEQAKVEAKRLDDARIERNKAFAKTHADYEEVIGTLAEHDLMIPDYMTQYLMESDSSAAVMYHFAKHPEVFEGIAKLSPVKALAGIGKLEATLDKEETAPIPGETLAKETPISRAPAPITPVNGTNGSGHKSPYEMNYEETKAYWAERDKASQSRRQRH
jgi:hypothetical protein